MRLPRVFKFYRAYEAFDRYSDSECMRLTVQAKLRRGDAAWVLPLGISFVAFCSAIGLGYLVVEVVLAIARSSGKTNVDLSRVLWGGNIVFASVMLLGSFLFLRRQMLVRSMLKIADRAACPFCEFSLVGLSITAGAVRCPECGQRVVLHEHHIRDEDLIADSPAARAREREKWTKLGTDRLGAYTGGAPEQNGPRGALPQGWQRLDRKRPASGDSGLGKPA